MTTSAIAVDGVTKSFGSTVALAGVDLEVPEGVIFGLLGPNGAGKTTLVRVLATLLQPDAGRAQVMGRDVVDEAVAVRESLGLTGQYAAVDEILTGRENLEMFARLFKLSRAEASKRAGELLERFDLADAADRPARTYSGGMRRRLDLASSLVTRPQVLFLDEPTTGLDPRSRLEIWASLRELQREGTTLLLTTQYLEEADELADEITVIDHGRVIANDTPQGLKRIVGGQRLTVRPADAERLPDAVAIVGEVAGARPDVDRGGQIRVPVPGDEVLAEAVSRFSAEGIALAELSLHLPSLDEAFLALTGTGNPRPTLALAEAAA